MCTFKLASSSLLKIGQETDKTTTRNRESVYLLLDMVSLVLIFISKEVLVIQDGLFLAFKWLNNKKSWGTFLIPCVLFTQATHLLKIDYITCILPHGNHIKKQQNQRLALPIRYSSWIVFFNLLENTWALQFPSVSVSTLPVFCILTPFYPNLINLIKFSKSNKIFCNSLYLVPFFTVNETAMLVCTMWILTHLK